MTTQTQTPEERLSKLEGAYEQVNERLGELTQAVRQVEANLRAEVKDEIRGVRTEIRTMLLLIGALWASMVGGFIALFLAM